MKKQILLASFFVFCLLLPYLYAQLGTGTGNTEIVTKYCASPKLCKTANTCVSYSSDSCTNSNCSGMSGCACNAATYTNVLSVGSCATFWSSGGPCDNYSTYYCALGGGYISKDYLGNCNDYWHDVLYSASNVCVP